jgi:hypothetical protein
LFLFQFTPTFLFLKEKFVANIFCGGFAAKYLLAKSYVLILFYILNVDLERKEIKSE